MKSIAELSIVLAGTVILSGAIAWTYSPSLNGEFIVDDSVSIQSNESIRQLWPLWGISETGEPLRPKLNTPLSARPLVNLSFALNYHFGSLNPRGYRIVQILLHSIASLMLWAVVWETLKQPCFAGRFDPIALPLALTCAAFWALHPLNSETVVYVTQRTELMMGLFMLTAIWCSIRYWRANSRKSRWMWCIAAGMCCQFGILSKETMATIPAVVIAYWWVLVRPSGKRADDSTLTLAASAPLLVTLMSCWVTVACIYNGGFATPGGGFGNTIHAVDWWYTQSHAVFLYLKLCAWPCPLLIHYDFPIHTNIQLCWPWVMGCTILIFTTAYLLSRRSASGFVLAVFFIVLSPSLIIPLPGETIAERRMYMPLAAIAPFAVVIAVQAIRITTARFALTASRHTLQSLAWSVPVLAIIGTFAFWSRARMPAYHSQLTIWYDSMTHQPHDAVSTMNVGVFLSLAGQQQAAISCLEKAVSMRPDFERARFNLGYGYESMNQIEAAIEQYQAAVRAGTTAATYYNLARLQASAGDIEAAIKNYREACRLRPKFADAHTNLSVLLIVSAPEKKENIQEAISHLESATSLNPSAENLYKLMMAYLLAHNFQQANRTGEKASLAAQQEGDIELIAQIETANRELQTQLTAK